MGAGLARLVMSKESINSRAQRLVKEMHAKESRILSRTKGLVEVESPSHDKAAVDRCVDLVEALCKGMGGRVRRHQRKELGDLLEARFGHGGRGGKPVMVLGHLDTVWEMGTLKRMPFRVADGRVWGPGALDMKSGVAMALTAIEHLIETKLLDRQVILLLVSDEEIGSVASRSLTEKLALECEAVYVLESAQGLAGAYKTQRKGVGEYTVHVKGVASHSGVDFERGHSKST